MIFLKKGTFLFTLSSLFLFGASDPSQEAYDAYIAGKKALEVGDERGAQKELERAYTLDPENPDIAVVLAYLYLRQGNEKRARQLFSKVLIQVPHYEDAHEGLKILNKREKRREEQQRLAQIKALVDEAQRYEKSGQRARAAEVWQKLMKQEPENPLYPYKLGRYFARAGRDEEAEAYLRKSLALSPHDVDTKVVLAYLLVKKGELAEAKHLFREVLEVVPDYADAEKGIEQIASIEREKRLGPKPRFSQEEKEAMEPALCYEERRDYDRAAKIWYKLYCAHPDSAYYTYRLGRIYTLQRKYRAAKPLLIKAAYSKEEGEVAMQLLTRVYRALGEREEAHNLAQFLHEHNKENTDYVESVARTHTALNRFSDARDLYTQRFTLGEPYYGLFTQYHRTAQWTNPSAKGAMLYAQERETDIITRLLAAQRNTALAILTGTQPLCDQLRLTGTVIGSTIREKNLIAGVNNLFLKTQDYALRATWLTSPSFSMSGGLDYQVGRDIGDPRFPIGHRHRLLPSISLNYNAPIHFATFSLEYDTLVIKDFVSNPLKGNLLRRKTFFGRDEWHLFRRFLKVGGEGFYRYYQGNPYNRQWQGVVYAQGGFPKYQPCFFLRYWGQIGGFKTNETVYYSYKRQWQHSGFLIFSKQAPLNMQIDIAIEQAWQWNRKLNQPVNTLAFLNKLFRSYEKLFFEVKHLYRPDTEFSFRTNAYWDSTRYRTWDVKGNLTHVF